MESEENLRSKREDLLEPHEQLDPSAQMVSGLSLSYLFVSPLSASAFSLRIIPALSDSIFTVEQWLLGFLFSECEFIAVILKPYFTMSSVGR